MTSSFSVFLVLSIAFICAFALPQPGRKPENTNSGGSLLSERQKDRERALEELTRQCSDGRRELAIVLNKAAREHRDNDRYMSPLHVAILAVESCHVFKAENALLSIVDYELDGRSLPDGLDVSGDYFFPAAGALVHLRVDSKQVVDAMVVTAKTDRQLQLLTWVLFRRAGSADEARRILHASGSDRNKNLRKALAVLGRAPDLLPPRKKR